MMNRFQKRKGSLLAVVILLALIFALVSQIILRTAVTLERSKYDITLTGDTYNIIALGEVAIDAMVYDLGAAWRNYVFDIGEEPTVEVFDALVADISQQYFHDSVAGGRVYTPFTNQITMVSERDVELKDIVDFISFDSGTSDTMESVMKNMADSVNDFSIVIDAPLQLVMYVDDFGNEDDDEFSSGVSGRIGDIRATVHLTKGLREVTQTYLIKNINANFMETGAGIQLALDSSNAVILRVEQSVK